MNKQKKLNEANYFYKRVREEQKNLKYYLCLKEKQTKNNISIETLIYQSRLLK